MFDLLKFRKNTKPAVDKLYGEIFAQSRNSVFYTDYGVPDTVDGRFDLLLVHIFMVMQRLVGKKGAAKQVAQGLFDMTFADMDQSLRQAGVGDVGVPKHMRRMMKAFNGRMYAYREAIEEDQLPAALERNLYGTVDAPSADVLAAMAAYVAQNIDYINGQSLDDIVLGRVDFLPVDGAAQGEEKKYG